MPRAAYTKASHNAKGENTFQRVQTMSHYGAAPGLDAAPPNFIARHKRNRTIRLRQPCSYDAISYLHVLDAVMNSDPTIFLRARPLTQRLNNQYPTLVWNTRVVGEILSDIEHLFAWTLGDKRGLLDRSRDRDGHFYAIHYDRRTVALGRIVLDELLDLAQAEIRDQDLGRKPTDEEERDINLCESLKSLWPDD